MDTQAYINSGIIERYALGQASCYEAMELGSYVERFPEVRAALDEAMQAVDGLAQAAAVAPPAALRARVLEAVAREAAAGATSPSPGSLPGPQSVPATPTKPQTAATPSIPIPPPRPAPRLRSLQFATGIAALLAIAAGLAYLNQNNQNRDLRERTAALEQQVVDLTRQSGEWQSEVEQQVDQLALLRDAATRRIALMALPGAGTARVDVYWNPERKAAYFDVLSLPAVPNGKQYQLWAIVDGAPVDMGVLPLNDDAASWQAFPFVEAPQAFAITIEPEGGSAVPSLDQMIVLGNFSS